MIEKLFSESGSVSMIRLMSFLSLLIGAFIAVLGIEQGKDISQITMLSGMFVGSAFGAKVAQKFAENMEPKP